MRTSVSISTRVFGRQSARQSVLLLNGHMIYCQSPYLTLQKIVVHTTKFISRKEGMCPCVREDVHMIV